MATAGSAMIDVLVSAGVRRLYTVPGESFLELLDGAALHPALTLVSARHESGASFMAEADAKLCGAPAVAMATRGVGASNLAIGVHTAYQDSTPLVVLLGQVESSFLHREAFQEVDLTAFYGPITKWSVTADRADRLPELLARGLRIATSGRPGPVMIAVPADLLGQELPQGFDDSRLAVPALPAPVASAEDVALLSQRLVTAQAPVIIAGGGASGARDELAAVAEAYGAGVYAAFRRQDVIDNDHPLYLGHLGVSAPASVVRALREADVVLVVGCRLSEITTQGYELPAPSSEVVQVDIDPSALGATVPVVRGVLATARSTLAALRDAAPVRTPARDWGPARKAYVDSSTPTIARSDGGIDPAEVVIALADSVPDDTVVTNDAGNFSGFLHRYWRYRRPRTQLAPTNGAMGYAIPAAVAAKLAAPDRTVVAVVGDGGFLMTGAEIETAVRHEASITVVAFRNGLYGTIAMHQVQAFGRTAGTDIGEVDLAAFARSLGAKGVTVTDPDELVPTLKAAVHSPAVTVVDVVVDPDRIAPAARLSDLVGRRQAP